MAKNKKKEPEKKENTGDSNNSCKDRRCPYHGKLRVHGRIFKGTVKKIVKKRTAVEFERLIYLPKYERYMKKKIRLQAHIPDCIKIAIGDLVQVGECRPLSKITHHVILKRLSSKNK